MHTELPNESQSGSFGMTFFRHVLSITTLMIGSGIASLVIMDAETTVLASALQQGEPHDHHSTYHV
jgi:hypothetical protein